MITDMTKGNPSKILWAFSLPMLLSMAFQQLYNISDSIIAGKFAGSGALAAIGASYPITMIFMAVATGANVGSSVVISQLFGAKKMVHMKTAISTAIISVLTLAVIFTATGIALCPAMLKALNTPADILTDSELYLNIYILGLFFLFLYNIATGIFTALGDSKTPLYFLILSSAANVILDLLFVAKFKMGVGGAAWATFIAQGASSIMAAAVLFKRLSAIKVHSYPKFSLRMLKKISYISVPSILQQSFVSVGNLFIQTRVNFFGSDVIAGYSAAIKLNTFAITSFSTMGNAMSSYTAQNIGAGTLKRIPQGLKAGFVPLFAMAAPFFAAYFFFPKTMINLFLDNSGNEIINIGAEFLKIASPFYFAASVKLILDGVLRGAGKMSAFMASTFTDLVLRVVLAYIISTAMNSETGIWLSWPVGWVVGTLISVVFYIKLYKNDIKSKAR